jgi:hypothetical protein
VRSGGDLAVQTDRYASVHVYTWTRAEPVTVNGVTIATNVAIIGQCADCTGVNDIDVSPVLMQLIKGGGPDNTDNTAIAAEIQVDFS